MLLSLNWELPPDDLSRHRAGIFFCTYVKYLTLLGIIFYNFLGAVKNLECGLILLKIVKICGVGDKQSP
jgi:hypothetical protein